MLYGHKQNDKKKNMNFNLTYEWVIQEFIKLKGCCSITGIPFHIGTNKYFSLSIGRINDLIGHTKENCRIKDNV